MLSSVQTSNGGMPFVQTNRSLSLCNMRSPTTGSQPQDRVDLGSVLRRSEPRSLDSPTQKDMRSPASSLRLRTARVRTALIADLNSPQRSQLAERASARSSSQA